MNNTEIIEMIKDAAFFGGHLQNKNLKECRDFFDNVIEKQLDLCGVVNCVYVVTERDNYGDQLFKGVFSNKKQAIEYLAKDGLTESNIDEINEIELD